MVTREELLRKYVRELMCPVEWAMTERVAAILTELGDAMLQHSPEGSVGLRVERDNLRERIRDLQERLETAEARVKELEAKRARNEADP